MCRIILFTGTCTGCGGIFTWGDLSQELSCLEAKNTGIFGECRRGVQKEEHTFDQDCDQCTALAEVDEGYGEEEEVEGKQEEEIGGWARDKGKQKEGYPAHVSSKKSKGDGYSGSRGAVDEDGRRSKKRRTS